MEKKEYNAPQCLTFAIWCTDAVALVISGKIPGAGWDDDYE